MRTAFKRSVPSLPYRMKGEVTMVNQTEHIQSYMTYWAARIEQELKQVLPAEWAVPELLREAMHYSLMAGGKRLRPILLLAAAEAASGPAACEAAIDAACAIEAVHTYSLVHDDLPAMDNDDLRRGKPTNHKVFGEAMAILAGDGLLTHAFHLVTRSVHRHGVSAETALQIIADLAKLAGAAGMVGGQAADMLGEQGITDLAGLEFIHRHKTGDLIAFSLIAGGRIGGATPNQLKALESYGYQIGLAFQIQDDILDLTGDETKIGKPVKSDVKQQKVTYPYLLGLEESRAKAAALTEEAKKAVADADFAHPERLLQLADYLMKRDH